METWTVVQMAPPTGHLSTCAVTVSSLRFFWCIYKQIVLIYLYKYLFYYYAIIIIMFVSGMLPKPVADDLRQGRTAEAQSYSNATVYFRQEWKLLMIEK